MARKNTLPEDVVLTPAEIFRISGYKRVAKQKEHFEALGVPAIIRPDNTLSVIRDHLRNPPGRRVVNEPPQRVRNVRHQR